MYCPKCGAQNSEDAQFCKECGCRSSGIIPAYKKKKIWIVLVILFLFIVGGLLMKTLLFEKGISLEKILPAGVAFKTFSTEKGFTVKYPDWPILKKTESGIIIGKENEAVMVIEEKPEGAELGYLLKDLSEEEIKKREKELKQVIREEGINLINLKLTRDSMLMEGTITGAKVEGEVIKYITIDKSKLYHIYSFLKSSNGEEELGITIFSLENKWPKYKNIVKQVIDSIEVLPFQQTETEVLAQTRDARRKADMRQILTAQEMYYKQNGKYKTANTQYGLPAIKPYYYKDLDDPQSTIGKHYKWLDNNGCPHRYCTYAILENKGNCVNTKFFAASEKGHKEICKSEIDFTAKTDGCFCW